MREFSYAHYLHRRLLINKFNPRGTGHELKRVERDRAISTCSNIHTVISDSSLTLVVVFIQ